jgi:hypothetical protein
MRTRVFRMKIRYIVHPGFDFFFMSVKMDYEGDWFHWL